MTVVASEFSMNVTEAAAALGTSAASVRKWADAGLLRSLRTPGGFRRFRAADVRAFGESLIRNEVAS